MMTKLPKETLIATDYRGLEVNVTRLREAHKRLEALTDVLEIVVDGENEEGTIDLHAIRSGPTASVLAFVITEFRRLTCQIGEEIEEPSEEGRRTEGTVRL